MHDSVLPAFHFTHSARSEMWPLLHKNEIATLMWCYISLSLSLPFHACYYEKSHTIPVLRDPSEEGKYECCRIWSGFSPLGVKVTWPLRLGVRCERDTFAERCVMVVRRFIPARQWAIKDSNSVIFDTNNPGITSRMEEYVAFAASFFRNGGRAKV